MSDARERSDRDVSKVLALEADAAGKMK
jgi:hypothetical protein